mmetsp:Transcript_11923/g.20160  ORF Transcript_11923/g.20160 Transcript_11923/m.20160 type:complete len:218 (-) Transcript_11923:139-792(-)
MQKLIHIRDQSQQGYLGSLLTSLKSLWYKHQDNIEPRKAFEVDAQDLLGLVEGLNLYTEELHSVMQSPRFSLFINQRANPHLRGVILEEKWKQGQRQVGKRYFLPLSKKFVPYLPSQLQRVRKIQKVRINVIENKAQLLLYINSLNLVSVNLIKEAAKVTTSQKQSSEERSRQLSAFLDLLLVMSAPQHSYSAHLLLRYEREWKQVLERTAGSMSEA